MDGIGANPECSAISALICSCPTNNPPDMLPMYIASMSSPFILASFIAPTPASTTKSLNDLSHSSPNFVWNAPTIATSLIITPPRF